MRFTLRPALELPPNVLTRRSAWQISKSIIAPGKGNSGQGAC